MTMTIMTTIGKFMHECFIQIIHPYMFSPLAPLFLFSQVHGLFFFNQLKTHTDMNISYQFYLYMVVIYIYIYVCGIYIFSLVIISWAWVAYQKATREPPSFLSKLVAYSSSSRGWVFMRFSSFMFVFSQYCHLCTWVTILLRFHGCRFPVQGRHYLIAGVLFL